MLAVIVEIFACLLIVLVKYVKINAIGSISAATDEEGSQQIVVISERYDLIQSAIQIMAYALIIVLLFLLAQDFVSTLLMEYFNLESQSLWALLLIVAAVVLLLLGQSGNFLRRFIRYRSIARTPPANFWENYARYEEIGLDLTTWRQWGGGPIRSFRKVASLPKYELLDDSVIIDLKFLPIGKRSRKAYKFRVGFDELDEIRQFLSSGQTRVFLKYTVGPNPGFAFRKMRDFRRYLKGKIPRPTIYISRYCDAGQTVLLRGPKLFYIFEFDTDDASDLIEAFQNFKATRN
jgi:hypothetical protein